MSSQVAKSIKYNWSEFKKKRLVSVTAELSRYKVAACNVAQITGSRKQITLVNGGLFHNVFVVILKTK